MAQAISLVIRSLIIEHHQSGLSNPKISSKVGVCLETVRTIVNRFKKEGVSGLKPRYDNCGQSYRSESNVVYDRAMDLRREHPSWGSPYIRSLLLKEYTEVVSIRTLNRWFKAGGLNEKKV